MAGEGDNQDAAHNMGNHLPLLPGNLRDGRLAMGRDRGPGPIPQGGRGQLLGAAGSGKASRVPRPALYSRPVSWAVGDVEATDFRFPEQGPHSFPSFSQAGLPENVLGLGEVGSLVTLAAVTFPACLPFNKTDSKRVVGTCTSWAPAVNALHAFLLLLLHQSSVQSLACRGETYRRIVKCVPFSDVEGHIVADTGLLLGVLIQLISQLSLCGGSYLVVFLRFEHNIPIFKRLKRSVLPISPALCFYGL